MPVEQYQLPAVNPPNAGQLQEEVASRLPGGVNVLRSRTRGLDAEIETDVALSPSAKTQVQDFITSHAWLSEEGWRQAREDSEIARIEGLVDRIGNFTELRRFLKKLVRYLLTKEEIN